MSRRRRLQAMFALLVVLLAAYVLTRGRRTPTPNPPGSFSFAVFGDAPYYGWEELQYRIVLQEIEACDLSFAINVGDILWRPCSEERYRRSLDWFNGIRHPVIYTPGDNEWTDCWARVTGSFAPLERLQRIRQLFFDDPTHSLGATRLSLVRQASRAEFPEFVENARWLDRGVVFATVHVVGSKNGLDPFAGRSEADDIEVRRRTEAAAAWVRETFTEAREGGAASVVLAFHANPSFSSPPEDPYRGAFEPFLAVLEEEVERYAGPVLVVHGDDHEFIVDRPLFRRTTGRRLDNLTRLQVPGSPEVGWVRVFVTPGAEAPFAFENHVVPRWKYW